MLSDAATEGLCPACLLRAGLAPFDEPTSSVADSLPPAGTSLTYLGDYELIEEIARGGMGVVYKARQASLGRIVALKMILSGRLADAEAVARFQGEAESAASLDHAGIVPVFEVGEHQGHHYFSMAWIDGPSLAERIQDGPLPPREAAEIIRRTAEAIFYAHQHGVIHRDLKPANILLEPRADDEGSLYLHPRVTDFGLAKSLTADQGLTATGQVLGTPGYMAPEQTRGRPEDVGPPADVYALGAVLYALLTGRPPFRASTPIETLAQVNDRDPISPRQLNPDIARDLETICLKCLEKDPDRRYASARDLADDLRCYVLGLPVKARPAGLVEKSLRWLKKRKGVAALAGGSAAAAALVLAVSLALAHLYQRSHLGRLQLSTAEAPLVARVLDAQDQLVRPEFWVPTTEDIELPAGQHRLELSREGQPSEIWPLNIAPSKTVSHEVSLVDRQIGLPIAMADQEWLIGSVPLRDQRRGLLLMRADGEVPMALRLVDPATGQDLWPEPFVGSPKTQLLPSSWNGYMWSEQGLRGQFLTAPGDVDGDGAADIVYFTRSDAAPSIVAVSGAEGKELWHYVAAPSRGNAKGSAAVALVGEPILFDVDADQVLDVVSRFAWWKDGGTRISTEDESWIAAVSGKTGEQLWRRTMSAQDLPLNYRYTARSNNGTSSWGQQEPSDYHAYRRIVIQEVDGQAIGFVCVGHRLISVDLANGEQAYPPADYPFLPFSQPFIASVPGGGIAALVMLEEPIGAHKNGVPVVQPNGYRYWFRAIDPATGTTLWQDEVPLKAVEIGNWDEWPRAVRYLSLSTDRHAVTVPVKRFDGRGLWCGLRLIDVTNGHTLWERWLLKEGGFNDFPLADIQRGPDLDGDGLAEVLILWEDISARRTAGKLLCISALSGKDGTVLWQTRRPGTGLNERRTNTIRFGQIGEDGWPRLLVQGSEPRIHALAASTGRLVATLDGFLQPLVADLDADGLKDLAFTQESSGTKTLHRYAGSVPPIWRAFGERALTGDLDGDGTLDVWETQRESSGSSQFVIAASSGHDGQRLWEYALREDTGGHSPFFGIEAPQGAADFNGDGHGDLLVYHSTAPNFEGSDWNVLRAVSPREGRVLWERVAAVPPEIASLSRLDDVRIATATLMQDAPPDVLLLAPSRRTNEETLVCIDGSDGRHRWHQAVARDSFSPADRFSVDSLGDVNSDGTKDLIVWKRTPDGAPGPLQLAALDGRSGNWIWQAADVTAGQLPQHTTEYWPSPVVADLDGDGEPEVIAARRVSVNSGREGSWQVLVLDGRQGSVQWLYDWEPGGQKLPVLVANLAGDGRKSVCCATLDNGRLHITVLDAEGTVAQTLSGTSASESPHDAMEDTVRAAGWAVADVDTDQRDELLYFSDGKLIAGAGDEPLWSWQLPDTNARLLEANRTSPHGEPYVLLWSGNQVYGVSGKSGKVIYRGQAPPAEVSRNGIVRHRLEVLTTPSSRVWPSFAQLATDLRYAQGPHTVVHRAWPTDANGRIVPLKTQRVTYAALPEQLSEVRRRLPWHLNGMELLLGTGILPAALLVLPLWLVWWVMRSGQYWWGWLPIAYGALFVAVPVMLERLGFSTTRPVTGPSLLVLLLPAALLWVAVRQIRYHAWMYAIAYAILAATPLVYVHYEGAGHPLSRHNALGNFYWVDESGGEVLLLSMILLPNFIFLLAAFGALRGGQSRRLAALFAAAVVTAVGIAAVILWIAAPHDDPSPPPYSLQGWWIPIFFGTYAVGCVLLILWLSRWIPIRNGRGSVTRRR